MCQRFTLEGARFVFGPGCSAEKDAATVVAESGAFMHSVGRFSNV